MIPNKIKIFILAFIIIDIVLSNFNKISNIKICVCTCAKQENEYVREFVEYYKNYGVDKIFIYDNNDEKDVRLETYISEYVNNGYVQIINYRERKKIQFKAFNECYQENKNKYNWFIYYDIDEFIHLENYQNIKTYLNSKKFLKCDLIYLNHVIRKDNNEIYYRNKSVFERFTQTENFKNVNISYKPRRALLDITKMIIRGNLTNIHFGSPHFININNTCNGFGKIINHTGIHLEKPNYDKYYFDHFYFKSCEEYLNKLTKGDVVYGVNRGFNIYWFEIYFAFNEITDEKLDYFENKTGTNLSIFRNKIKK